MLRKRMAFSLAADVSYDCSPVTDYAEVISSAFELVSSNALILRVKDNVAQDSATRTDASQPSDMGALLRYLSHQITSYSS
jgi:hypothetical protein